MAESAHDGMALTPLWAAKARIPLLPLRHVPRPRPVALMTKAVRTHRLVIVAAGALTGKTTLLAEWASRPRRERVYWYSCDAVDYSPHALLGGLLQAVQGAALPLADDIHLLGALIGALGRDGAPVVLIVDDVHRTPAAAPVLDQVLRYLPPTAHLVVSAWPRRLPDLAHVQWLDDRGQVALLGTADLRLDAQEQERFRQRSGRPGDAWAVSYRPGGQMAVVQGLRQGLLPALPADLRAIVDVLAVLSGASLATLSGILARDRDWMARRVARLLDETILLEQLGATAYRLSETAQQAVLSDLDPIAVTALRRAAAMALAPHEPAQAAYLYALAGDAPEAASAAARVSWWGWQEHGTWALALADLLPAAYLRRAPALALVIARRRRLEQGSAAVHAFIRSLRPSEPVDRIEQLLLLAYCYATRNRPWSLARCIAALEALTDHPPTALAARTYAYGLLARGIAQGLADVYAGAATTLRRCLDALALDGSDDSATATLRLSAYRALAVAERRQGHLEEAEHIYVQAEMEAERVGSMYVRLEITNNRAVVLQQRGAHAESAEILRAALASPWSAERGLRPLLHASLADALAASGDREGAARALHAALADLDVSDVYGLTGSVRAMRAVHLAESGHAVAAQAELAAGAPPGHPATLLAQALLCDPLRPEAVVALQAALEAAGADRPLRAQICAHLARVCALQGERVGARRWTDAAMQDRSYPLTPREAAILGPRPRRRRARSLAPPVAANATHVVIRFFGTPLVTVQGQPVANPWWMQSKARELFWYALAHGSAGFTREEACADVFPELDGERAARALRNLLYELRQLVRRLGGSRSALMLMGGRMQLRPEDLGSDWEADTATLQQWLGRLREDDLAGVGDLPLLVAGRYLADLPADWTRPFRHYWEREALHGLDLAAAQYERAGRAAEALACLRRALELCPDETALVRRVMLLYQALGDHSGARATFLAHRRALREELGDDPDPALVRLYATVTQA